MTTVRELVTRWKFEADKKPVEQFDKSVEHTKTTVQTTERQVKQFEQTVTSLKDRVKAARAEFDAFAPGLKKVAEGTKAAGSYLTTRLTLPIIGFLGYAIKAQGEVEKIESKFNVVFSRNLDDMNRWAEEQSKILDRDADTVRKFASDLSDLVVPMGLAEKEAIKLTKAAVPLVEDWASFYNMTEDAAFETLQSGLVGISRPLLNVGVKMNEATIAAAQARLGFKGAFDELSEGEKILVRFNLITEGTRNAWGSATKDADKFKNQMVALRDDVGDIAENFGSDLMPVLADYIKILREGVDSLKAMDKEQRLQILKWGAIVASIGPALIVMGVMSGLILNMIGLYRALSTAIVGKTAATIADTTAMTANAGAVAVNRQALGYLSGGMTTATKATTGLAGAFGGPWGLVVMLGLAAAAYAVLTIRADNATYAMAKARAEKLKLDQAKEPAIGSEASKKSERDKIITALEAEMNEAQATGNTGRFRQARRRLMQARKQFGMKDLEKSASPKPPGATSAAADSGGGKGGGASDAGETVSPYFQDGFGDTGEGIQVLGSARASELMADSRIASAMAAAGSRMLRSGVTSNRTVYEIRQDIQIDVDGAKSPAETAAAIDARLRDTALRAGLGL